ncbi:MAG TPA: adenylate/guanylate cyclase domain-containing protein [Beijerinckiaceae bacterium]|nr:adenylate/guanylate cyclase domain-containing protein [Beijerinckiaceae bacterium]
MPAPATLSPARAALDRLVAAGTGGHPPKVRRRLKVLNAMAFLVVAFSLLFALTYALEGPARYPWPILINLGIAAVAAAVPFLHRFGELAGALAIAAAECVGLFVLVALLGRESGIQLNLVVGAAVAFAVLGIERLRMVAAILAVAFSLHVAAWFLFPQGLGPAPDPAFLGQLYVSSALTAFVVTAALAYYAFRLAETAEAETEALLRNVLPESVVERLKAGEAVAESFAEASILFADLQGFVPLSRRLGAQGTVGLLGDLVTALDRLAAQHGVEKIKTIGDCYMAAAGLPEPAPDHAARLVRFALAIQEAAAQTATRHGIELRLRIGIAAGPVMAGVIGTRKFSYDVWGDPVNLAARLENAGEAGRIHVCATTRARLEGVFPFVPRGGLELKGLGPQETWFLARPGEESRAA